MKKSFLEILYLDYSFVSVLPGVTIGENSIIGANSVVTKSIPANSIAVGIPAKVIKQYNIETKRWEKV